MYICQLIRNISGGFLQFYVFFFYLTMRAVSGIYTGSIYKDNTLKRSGFLGEGIHDGTVICTKTHEWPGHEPKLKITFERALLVVRRPEDALRSYFQNRHVGHTGSIHLSKANMEKSMDVEVCFLFSSSHT